MSDRMIVLIVDDDQTDRLAIRRLLRGGPLAIELVEAESIADALEYIIHREIQCVIADYRLAAESGLDLLRTVRGMEERDPTDGGVPIIILTGQGDERIAVEAMKAGATDYVPKNELTADRLTSVIRTGIEIHRRRSEARKAQVALQRAHDELELRVRQRTVELERTNAELRQRNTELDEFTFVASHDLQEPLRKLVAFSELLPGDVGGDLSEVAKNDLHYIVEAANRMQSLVADLLLLSRAGKDALRRQPVSLERCADEAIRALTTRIDETGAEISRDNLPTVVGDPTLLTQLYQNLIGNALKFTRHDRLPRVRLTAEERLSETILGVRDNGIGIKPEYAAQIFAPFKRLHGRDEYEGSGIGLSICRKTVERHGGRIWVESTPGKGTHFRFTLDCEPEVEKGEATPKNEPASAIAADPLAHLRAMKAAERTTNSRSGWVHDRSGG